MRCPRARKSSCAVRANTAAAYDNYLSISEGGEAGVGEKDAVARQLFEDEFCSFVSCCQVREWSREACRHRSLLLSPVPQARRSSRLPYSTVVSVRRDQVVLPQSAAESSVSGRRPCVPSVGAGTQV